jgi:hypothetical protein
VTTTASPNPTDKAPGPARSSAVWPSRRTFYTGLAVVCAVALTVAAAQANQAFLILGAVIVAAVADGFELRSGTWLGWRRPVDGSRLIILAAAFVGAMVVLAGIAYAIEDKVYLSGT